MLLCLPFALAGCSLAESPQARNGVLDLRESVAPAPVVGEWIVSAGGDTKTQEAPLNAWTPEPPSASAKAWTLNILMPGTDDYGLIVPFPGEIPALSLGGKAILDSSRAPTNRGGFALVRFRADSSVLLRLELPASGWSPGRLAFFAAPLLIGPERTLEALPSRLSIAAGVKLGVFGGMTLMALLLALVCRSRKEPLALAGYLVSAAFFCLVKDCPFLGFPVLSSGTRETLYLCALALRSLGLAGFALSVFPSLLRGALCLIVLAPPLLLAAAPFVPAVSLDLLVLVTFGWGALLSTVLAAYAAWRAARGERGGWLFLAGQIALLAAYAARWTLGASPLVSWVLEPAGAGVFALLATILVVRGVGNVYREAGALSAYVDSVSTTVRRFIPTEFMEYLQKSDITDLRLGDHVRKEMTIFFSDIRAFTRLSEDLTPEENFAFINSYLSRMVPLIRERGGFVDKYVGDGIMALFPDKQGADQALRASLEMQKRMVEYNRHRASVGYRSIDMGIGIHTGTLMLGVVGVQDRMENTVISDAVNLSSRLQAIAKAFDIGVVISEQCFKSLDDAGQFKYRFIGKVRVKGKAAPVSCFEIFDDTQDSAFELKMKANTFFEQGMLSYYQKEFLDAIYYFKRALEILPRDGAARFYLETCLRKTH